MHKLFVFLRSDLESMTPGKAAAQVAHAASQAANRYYRRAPDQLDSLKGYVEWENSPEEEAGEKDRALQGFGTTIVLDAGRLSDISADPESAAIFTAMGLKPTTAFDNLDALMKGIIRDPSYPLRDGLVTHGLDLITCYWIFDDPDTNRELGRYLKNFSLYNGFNPAS